MFQKKIILDVTDSLSVTWEKNWASLRVKHNNQEIGALTDKTALEMGQWMILKDGRLISFIENESI